MTRVTTLELFFDLVFVFTITQLTQLLVGDLSWETLWHVGVLLALIFYMYDGYVWLTNSVRATEAQGLLLGGMACYLVVSVAIPDAFSSTGLTFGLAYLVIVGIHSFLFLRVASEGSSRAMRFVAPRNVQAALFVAVGGALGGTVQEVLWTVVVLWEWFGVRTEGFEIGAAHFVERHGLLVIVAIGESVVAIGVGARGLVVDVELVALVTLGLLLCAGLWWTYFGGDEDATVERAMEGVAGGERARVALAGFGYSHFLLLLGVILTAVGIEDTIAHPGEQLDLSGALALSGGVSVFLAGDAYFRRSLGLGRTRSRAAAAVVVLLAVPVGASVSAAAGLALTTALFGGSLMLEARTARAS